jgi:hypothetical protein
MRLARVRRTAPPTLRIVDATDLAEFVVESFGDVRPEMNSDSARLRIVRQFIMDVEHSPRPDHTIETAPVLSGDRGWDALIAGVVEDLAFRLGLPVPACTREPTRNTDDRWWFVTAYTDMHPTAFVETPASLANRGVFIRRASLVNV